MAENTSFHIDNIIVDPDLQCREGIDENHVKDMADALRSRPPAKIKRPRVIWIDDPEDKAHDGKIYAVDQHRVEAYREAGKKEVPVLKHIGTWQTARDMATSSNVEHNALKRSNAAKERAVQMCWEDHPDWTPGRVAKHCSVSGGMAKEWMETVPAAKAVPQENRVGLDGKKRRAPKASKNGKPKRDPTDWEQFAESIFSALTLFTRRINDAMNQPDSEESKKFRTYLTYFKLVKHPGARTVVEGDNVTPEPVFTGFPILRLLVRAARQAGRVKTFDELKAMIEKWKEEKQSFVPNRS